MAKKKRVKPIKPEKKSYLTLIYTGLAVLLMAAMALYLSTGTEPEKPQERLPTEGDWEKISNMPTTYEPGRVKIIEFLKFDCSHCYDLHKNMPQLLEKYGDRVEITYIPIVWPGQSTKSIEAYNISKQMGKGEEMRDALFQAKFVRGMDIMGSIQAMEDVAAGAGLGPDFNTKLEGNYAKDATRSSLELMSRYDVQATPTIIINGNLQVDPTVTNLDKVIGSLLS